MNTISLSLEDNLYSRGESSDPLKGGSWENGRMITRQLEFKEQERGWAIQQSECDVTLVCSGCNYKMPLMCRLNNRHLFLIVLEARKFKIQAAGNPAPAEGKLPGSQTAIFSLCPHMAKGRRDSLGLLLGH